MISDHLSKQKIMRLLSWLLISTVLLLTGCQSMQTKSYEATIPLASDLGKHHYAISTSNPDSQRYFDQGLILAFGFNHAEAANSFRESYRLDPNCALCYWGEALVLGPNINAPMDPSRCTESF